MKTLLYIAYISFHISTRHTQLHIHIARTVPPLQPCSCTFDISNTILASHR